MKLKNKMKQPIIETDRLYMRELQQTDVDGMFELDSNAAVHQFLGNNPIKSKEEAAKVIDFVRKQYEDLGIGRWAVVLKETDEFIGWSGLKFFKETVNGEKDFYELGYRFIEKHWGKGYATETAKASITYAFDVLKQEKVFAMTELGHKASISVLEKIGFRNKGTFEFKLLEKPETLYWFELNKPQDL